MERRIDLGAAVVAVAVDGTAVVAVAVGESDALKRWEAGLEREKEWVVIDRRSLERSCLVDPRIWGSERLEDGVGVFDGAESLIWYSLTFNSAPQLFGTHFPSQDCLYPGRRKFIPYLYKTNTTS